MFSTRYVYMYTLALAAFSAISLALFVTVLKPIHVSNEAVFKKKDILASIAGEIGFDPKTTPNAKILSFFEENVDQLVIDANGVKVEGVEAESIDMAAEEKKPLADRKYPVFIYKGKNGNIYLAAVRGNGLWDKIWGTIAVKDDLNTIVGASFGHQGETPGLGAEIKDNPSFPGAFVGKELFKNGEFVSVSVSKTAGDPKHHVDAISGATITSVGVSDMLEKGFQPYIPYFSGIKGKS